MLSSGISYFHRGQKLIVFCLLHILNKNLQCDKYLHAFCCLKMKMKLWKIIVVQDFWILKNQTLESQICLSVFQKKEESYLLKLYTK